MWCWKARGCSRGTLWYRRLTRSSCRPMAILSPCSNGVRLGAEPTPLLHGDKIAIGRHELRVVDSTRGGSTQLFDSGAFADLVPPRSNKPPAGTTGGRLVCLTDGREYTVGQGPLRIGRDASSDVVVTGTDVSRQHA